MASVNDMRVLAHGWSKAKVVANAVHREAPRWHDPSGDDSGWWRTIPARSAEGQVSIAKVFHTWVRAYLVSLKTNADDPGADGDACREVLEELQSAGNKDSEGRIRMAAVVESFARCPGDVVYHALCLLNWAGHMCARSTLDTYQYAVTAVVTAYWSAMSARRRVEDATVRTPHQPVALMH